MGSFLYPTLPLHKPETEAEMWNTFTSFAGSLRNLLEYKDALDEATGAVRIIRVVSVGDIGQPDSGDVAYSTSAEKFRGYTSASGWVDLN